MSDDLEAVMNGTDDELDTEAEAEKQDADTEDKGQQKAEGDTDDKADKAESEDADKPDDAGAKGEKEDETPSSEDEDPETSGFKKGMMEERKKRQELERRLKEIEEGGSGKDKADTPSQEQKPPDPLDDPEGYARWHQQQTSQQLANVKLDLSRDMMRSLHDDYDQKEAEFVEMARQNPVLAQQLQQSSNPARFAYETAAKAAELKKLENVDEYKAQLRKEVEEDFRKEQEAKQAKEREKDEAITPSLSTARSSKAAVPDDGEPDDLDELLN